MALVYFLVLAFLIGAAVGSFLNVCIARLPYEKSLLWPSSRCGSCLQPIRLRDNVPILSYLLLRGRCRTCQAPFSVGYFLVELFTALAFTGLAYLVVFANVRELRFLHEFWGLPYGIPPGEALPLFVHHATLLSFLLVVSLCDLADMEIPLSVTVTGTLIGLAFATLMPWPYPDELGRAPFRGPDVPPPAIYPWPVWYPLPDWLPKGSWQLGLATGLAGALAGMILLRGVRFLFGLGRGIEGLGMGDADLMMMAGAFVGWQPVVVAFFVSVFPALFFGVIQVARKGNQALPFGPSLSAGVLITLLAWPHLGPPFQMVFFHAQFMGILVAAGALMLLITSFLLRMVRGK
jgi:leader peptidase (prepilin peptidase)/N-methyltransferase